MPDVGCNTNMKLLIILLVLSQIGFGQKTDNSFLTDKSKANLKQIAFDLQNRGQLLDEREHKFEEATKYIDSALKIFETLDDSLNLANNLKLYGYLLARQKAFGKAKIEIVKSINLFKAKGALWGVAVSNFDMARVYYLENKVDSAEYYCNSAMHFWKNKNDTDRIFIIRNLLIAVNLKSNNLTRAQEIQRLNSVTSDLKQQHWQNLLDFYTVSFLVFQEINDLASATKYRNNIDNLQQDLIKEQINALSFFE